jgi:hypothetical protein
MALPAPIGDLHYTADEITPFAVELRRAIERQRYYHHTGGAGTVVRITRIAAVARCGVRAQYTAGIRGTTVEYTVKRRKS